MRLPTRRPIRWAGVLALLGAAALTAVAVAGGTAGAADTPAKVDHFGTTTIRLNGTVNGFPTPAGGIGWAFLIFLQPVGGGPLITTYCIDIYDQAPKGADYTGTTWAASGRPNLPEIQWVLTHGAPLADLAAASGTTLTSEEAIAATQAAIWHYSDAFALTSYNHTTDPVRTTGPVITAYNYLVNGAAGSTLPEPGNQTLSLTPASSTGAAGSSIGPITVQSSGGPATLSLTGTVPAGASLVDATGQPITNPVATGSEVFV